MRGSHFERALRLMQTKNEAMGTQCRSGEERVCVGIGVSTYQIVRSMPEITQK
jgi:hypothetical protein